jgi:mono/diheme cytochrome c family protein
LNCKQCHGEDGKGYGVKVRADSTICPYDLSKLDKPDEEIYYVVLEGKNRMIGQHYKLESQHKLSDSTAWIVVFYINKFKNLR